MAWHRMACTKTDRRDHQCGLTPIQLYVLPYHIIAEQNRAEQGYSLSMYVDEMENK